MANKQNRRFLWNCPKCGNTMVLHVRATEVVCTNKQEHTSTAVQMEEMTSSKKR